MKIRISFLCLMAGATFVMSCQHRETQLETFRRINEEVKANSQAYATLGEATSTIGHRLTGSENGRKAEEYVYNKFKEYGFEDVQYQEFEVEAWAREKVAVTFDGESVPAVALGHSPVQANVTGNIIDMGNGLEEDYKLQPEAVRGKIAFFYIGILPGSGEGLNNLHRSEKTAIAIRHGATGVIIFNQVDNGVLLTGTASVTGDLISIPAVCIGKETGMSIKEKLKSKKVQAHIEMTNHSDMIRARNVVATLRGTEFPDSYIIAGGHLDSWDLATGAIDNGIGSFAILDMARAFTASHLQPRRSVRFVMFMGEEQGLLGSHYMVNQAIADHSIDQIGYMMNIDMGGNPIGIQTSGPLNDTTFFKSLGNEIAQVDSIFTNKIEADADLHSDHEPFMLEGVPVLGIVSNIDFSIYRCYHSDCDDFKLVNEEHIRNTARFGTMILYGVANAKVLPAKRMDSEATRQFLIDSGLKEPLVIAGDWKWEK